MNFTNPHRRRRNPAADAIKNAILVDDNTVLRYVRLPDLIALKLYAGSRQDLADIVELLARNRDVDLAEVRRVAAPYDETAVLETLIAEAAARR